MFDGLGGRLTEENKFMMLFINFVILATTTLHNASHLINLGLYF